VFYCNEYMRNSTENMKTLELQCVEHDVASKACKGIKREKRNVRIRRRSEGSEIEMDTGTEVSIIKQRYT
jgi:hypothetical protein